MSKRGYKMVEMVKNKSETGTTAVECKILPQTGLEKQNTSKPSITESKQVKSPQFVLTEFTPEIWLETTDPVTNNATGNNIIIECPEDIAEELGISGGVLEQSNNVLGTANAEGQNTNQDADDGNSSHSNESKGSGKLSEPSNHSNSSSSDEEIEIAPNTEINSEEPKRKRSLKGQVDGSSWKKNINIAKRRKGEEYEGRKLREGKTVPILKKKRQLGQACSSKLCSKAQSRYCNEFTQEDRLKIFENFWENMDWGQKKIFVSGLIDVCPPKSRKKNSSCTVPKKTVTLNYHLKKDNKRLSVCKLMFLNTLGIGEWSAREWALKGQHKSSLNVKKCKVPLKPKGNEHLESFLNELPKIPSHYCRAQSSKLYLEPIFKSQKEVFDVYVENCAESKIKPLSLTQFKKFFRQMNIGLFQPKKDQCDLCCMHEVNNISEEKWLEHQQMKEDARREMKADTERAKLDKSLMVITMDLQAVLLCPLLKASAIYRKKKLIFHNFTMFNNVTHETSKTNTNGPTELDTFLPQDNSITNGVTKYKVTKGNDLEAANTEFDPFKNRQNDHPTTNLNTLTHLLKASLGTGILSMPAAFQAAGLALGIFSTILVSIICTHCAYILVTSAHELYKRAHKTKMSFADVAEEACLRGPKWARGFAGPIRCYAVIIARNFNYVIDYYVGYTTEIRVTIAALLVPIILLVYVPNLKYLAPVSMIANVFMGIGLGITFYYLVTDVPSISERNLVADISTYPVFFSITIFAIEAIGVVMPLENHMATPQHFVGLCGVLNQGMSGVTLVYMVIGFFGYLKYGDKVEGSITLNLPKEAFAAQIVNILIALAVYGTFGLQFYVICVAIAIAVPTIIPFVALIGAFCFSILGLMVPVAIEMLTFWDKGFGPFHWKIFKNIIVVAAGLLALIFGSKSAIQDIVYMYLGNGTIPKEQIIVGNLTLVGNFSDTTPSS
ncbi:unnamed protein product [Callosobruchus maculatus]|uniref:Amino acid transporter transmembrane domain-containing protein n=1 Tax=Callosobruchus maculatus TaxID=64391 RepID=A0A653BWQ2_CALMS|nr:unnamed protein product [Callosobruchus maculatus]